MIGIIIQARLGSSRLPNKVMMPFYNGMGILEVITKKIIHEFKDVRIIVATSTKTVDDPIEILSRKLGVDIFRGSENNVLRRFIGAAEKFNLSQVVRVCSDNPFLNMKSLKELINYSYNEKFEYLSYITSNNVPSILTHFGLWAEVITTDALIKISHLTNDRGYLEHVTKYAYENKDFFNLKFLPIPSELENLENIRLTLDTKDDFILLKEIYSTLHDFNGSSSELVDVISRNKDWTLSMKNQIIKNNK